MELTINYVLSQIFTIIMYILLGVTYQIKNRKKLLYFSILSNFACGISYLLLSGLSGLSMCVLAILRDLITIVIDNNIKNVKIKKQAYLLVIILFFVAAITSMIYTYDGFYSLFSVFATLLYTYSIWQTNAVVYKIFGTPVSLCWIIYNIYIKSIFGVILESFILVTSLIGFIREKEHK